jgi:hypothetical protein
MLLQRDRVERFQFVVEFAIDLPHRKRHLHRCRERTRVIDEDQVPRLIDQQVALIAIDVRNEVVPHPLAIDLAVPRTHVGRCAGIALPQKRAVLDPELS